MLTANRTGALARLSGAIVLVTTTLLVTGCDRAAEEAPPEIRPVRTIVVSDDASGRSITLTGTVQAQNQVNFAFRIGGALIERNVDTGDVVEYGQVLARLDSEDQETSLQSARAQLAAAEGRLTEARNAFERQQMLVDRQLTSRAAFDQAEAALQTARSNVESAQANVDLAENRLGFTVLVADAGGVVTTVGAEPGEVVAPGRMIVRVARDDGKDAVFDVPARIKDAAPRYPELTVTLTTDPSISAAGRVREVSPQADAVTGLFQVRVGLNEAPAGLRLGSTVSGRMLTDAETVIAVPAAALMRQGDGNAVWVVNPETSRVAIRGITVSRHDVDRVVVASGLAPGDIVVTAGVQALHPDQQVRLLGGPRQ